MSFSLARIIMCPCPYCDNTGYRGFSSKKLCHKCDGKKYLFYCANCKEKIKKGYFMCSSVMSTQHECTRKETWPPEEKLPNKVFIAT